MKINLFDLLNIYESEVKKNVRNKKKILDFEKHKMEYLVDIKRVNYFGIKEVNAIYLNNLEIEEINCYKNNKYNELYLKVKLIELLEVLCKRGLK